MDCGKNYNSLISTKTAALIVTALFVFVFPAAVLPGGSGETVVYEPDTGDYFLRSQSDIKIFESFKIKKRRIHEYRFKKKDLHLLEKERGIKVETSEYESAKTRSYKIKDNVYRIELNGKKDGLWYRMKLKIPDGMEVSKIIRDGGSEIKNISRSDRKTGKITYEENWYVKDNWLYFYDDPVSGYSVVLSPPRPSFSIMAEEVNAASGGSGQMSALVYPYNGEADLLAGINAYDHMGRIGDNNFGNDIDADAGGKIALRYTSGANTYQYGNAGLKYNTFVTSAFAHIGTNYYHMNTTPWGEVESVIDTSFQTTSEANTEIPFLVNKKTIIRGNDIAPIFIHA